MKIAISGALKSNIGHLEGVSGLAGLVKAVMALEKGIIPPNANFEKVNPKIDPEYLRVKVNCWSIKRTSWIRGSFTPFVLVSTRSNTLANKWSKKSFRQLIRLRRGQLTYCP